MSSYLRCTQYREASINDLLSSRSLITVIFCLLFFAASSARAVNVVSIDYPGATYTAASGINNLGDVVGNYDDSAGSTHGFLLSKGVYTTIDVPGALLTSPAYINDSGEIAGIFEAADSKFHSYLFDGVSFTTIDLPGAINTVALGLNNLGEVVGYYEDANIHYHGFTWSSGTFTTVDVPGSMLTFVFGINDAGILVGLFNNEHNNSKSFARLVDGTFKEFNLPLQFNGGINNHDTTVGLVVDDGFRYNISTRTFFRFAFPNATVTVCYGINDSGTTVGYYLDHAFKTHGFMGGPM